MGEGLGVGVGVGVGPAVWRAALKGCGWCM